MSWWLTLLIATITFVGGGFIGFFTARHVIQKKIKQNPPITEAQIRYLYSQVGRKPSESDVKRIMQNMKNS